MSRLNDLIRQVSEKDPALAADLQREVAALADRRAFGLNFERHVPEAVELPGRRVRRGDKVRVLTPRGQTPTKSDEKLWRVAAIERDGDSAAAELVGLADDTETATAAVEDLVVVAEFRDPIYPGLVSTGKVERGGDKPYHTVINAENFHALQLLMFTHHGKVDCIYIDPPYNTGARDWKYNNDYVEGDDLYRHSKWLAFMERRLLLSKELLNPDDSVLIVTIDEKEYLRLGLLLEQSFPEATIQMISSVINPNGVARGKGFSRADEYLFVVFIGGASVTPFSHNMLSPEPASGGEITLWDRLMRRGTDARREDSPRQFYPFWVDPDNEAIVAVGDPLAAGASRDTVTPPQTGLVACWPIRSDDSEGRWKIGVALAREGVAEGTVKAGSFSKKIGQWSISYLYSKQKERIANGEIEVLGKDERGALILRHAGEVQRATAPVTVWNQASHNAAAGGTNLLRSLVPGRKFPFPKSLYAVEDALRFFVVNKPDAVVIDFFAGSGTTAHAVMRLNKQDGGRRRSICVTNNEVAADEQRGLREQGKRPGDPEWEQWGICDYFTKPRLGSAITGNAPDGQPIKGVYKFADEFSMAEGLEENVEFFTLTYEAPLRIASNREFERVAPLLWIRAGSRGRRIDDISKGWDVAEAYGVITDFDHTDEFLQALADKPDATHAVIVTDEDWLFESVCRDLPEHIDPVRLYEAYLRNFEIEAGRSAR